MDPTIAVAAIGAWGSILAVAVKGALDSRAAKAQTNGALQVPLAGLQDSVADLRAAVSDLAAELRDVKADVRDLKRSGGPAHLRREDLN